MQVSLTLLLFWITQGSPSRGSPYFLSKKNISLLVTLETVCLKGIWNLDLSIYLQGNSFVIKNFIKKFSNYTFQSFKHFNCWLSNTLVVGETEPLNNSITLSITQSITNLLHISYSTSISMSAVKLWLKKFHSLKCFT